MKLRIETIDHNGSEHVIGNIGDYGAKRTFWLNVSTVSTVCTDVCVAVGAGYTEQSGETAFQTGPIKTTCVDTERQQPCCCAQRAAQYSQFWRQADTGYSVHVGGHVRCGELHVHSAVTVPPHGAVITDVGAKLRQSQVHDTNNRACGHVCCTWA